MRRLYLRMNRLHLRKGFRPRRIVTSQCRSGARWFRDLGCLLLDRQREPKNRAVGLVRAADSLPPWASTVERLIACPMPIPSGLVV